MSIIEPILILVCMAAGAWSAFRIAWNRRLKPVWHKRGEIRIVHKPGLWTGIAEVMFQTRVIANRPVVGIAHMLVFYGFLSFAASKCYCI